MQFLRPSTSGETRIGGTSFHCERKELRQSGRLVIVVAARDDNDLHGLEPLMDHANAVLLDMVKDGTITAAERELRSAT